MPQPSGSVDSRDAIAPALLAWYDQHARILPWRAPPGAPAPDPYRVWLSEIMLQQTTVAAVRAYFEKFTRRWPTVADLAAADDAELMAAWAGLGYYARARNLIACARAVMADHDGQFPDTEDGLRALPGIGAYTAAAIAAIAFGRRAVVVDANAERVVARLFALSAPLSELKGDIRERTDQITPNDRAGDFAQAMMDLGATICTSKGPRCLLCPIAFGCEGKADPERFPGKKVKSAKPSRVGTAWWIEHEGHVLLHRRADKGMLGGMLALPSDNWSIRNGTPIGPPLSLDWEEAGMVSHVFTHFALDLKVLTGVAPSRELEGLWWPIATLSEAGLPTLFAKAATRAQASRQEETA